MESVHALNRYSFEAIGTQWEIDTEAPLSAALRHRLTAHIDAFSRVYSRFQANSLVTQIATAPGGGCFTFPPDSPALFQLYDQLHRLTGGAVDPLVGRRLERLGYDSHYSLRPEPGWQMAGPDDVCWSREVVRHGAVLRTQRPLLLDVGAAGKGYLVDSIACLLRAADVRAATVDAGGDLRQFGAGAVRVGLEHPLYPDRVIGVVELRNAALCASATTRRAWGPGLHHVLDARRGQPTADVLATWVIAPDALTADGLATALFFVSATVLQPSFSFAAVRMLANQTVEATANFPGEIFYQPFTQPSSMPQPSLPALRRSLIALALTALLGCAPKDSAIMPAAATTQAQTYKDGTYTATGTYGGLPSHLTVTVDLQQGLIRKVQVKTHATDPTSLDYQRRFANAVPQVVVGKPLKDVNVGKLAGASGCPIGFNDALDQIRKQAAE